MRDDFLFLFFMSLQWWLYMNLYTLHILQTDLVYQKGEIISSLFLTFEVANNSANSCPTWLQLDPPMAPRHSIVKDNGENKDD